ncbi:serine/threonine protein kinase [Streptomyces qinglanensis]|uniref:non-specific serine/threonine protein kinase n=1 Tax=Streptomyces qinglanensis TaxID=943816 RepID=A0A1E7KDY4_9ACTN|nr:serine/threonine-protein kinase [Streptomyces qinglanensis]OEV02132.1 serine/threonine protein kinase [Streptomyces qinglanensis]
MGEIFAGRYELVDPIGRGGAGTVWRAWDHRRRRYVAAKVLQQSDAHTLLRFVREQSLRIDHPHVLAPASWAADDEQVLFTMELVRGGSLAHLVGDYGALPPTFGCTLLDQLLSGLAAVHAEDVVHRDIKPANILLDCTGTGRPHLRLSDFGISMRKGEPRLTETNYVVGTPGYFAPEQMLEAEADFASDLYAVGLVGLHLLTGRKPDAQALFGEYEHGLPAAPEGVAEPLWQVLGQLLQPDPAVRFRTATGARKALAAAAELLDRDATVEQEAVEVFDHIGPLPGGFGPDGPLRPAPPGPDTAAGAATGTGGGTGSGTVAGSGTAGTAAEETAAGAAPAAAPAPGAAPAPRPSDTGSFPLQPPAAVPAAAATAAQPVPQQPATPPAAPPRPGPYSAAADQGTCASPAYGYPAGPPGAVRPAAPAAAPPAHGPAPARRPGPPLKVAVPMLLVALLCLATGVWALSAAA